VSTVCKIYGESISHCSSSIKCSKLSDLRGNKSTIATKTIKGVVFMTFWQGLIISILFHASKDNSDDISDGDDDLVRPSDSGVNFHSASSIQHVLICMEMLLFSVAHFCVFPAEEWEEGYKTKFYAGPGFGFKDFAQDVNLIINSGKQSMQARREKKSDSSDRNTTKSFGSMDENGTIDDRLDEHNLLV
jgi:hypothetical protein